VICKRLLIVLEVIDLATLHQPVYEGSVEGQLFVWEEAAIPRPPRTSPTTMLHLTCTNWSTRLHGSTTQNPEEEVAYHWFVFSCLPELFSLVLRVVFV
jgi:hypothetical protein